MKQGVVKRSVLSREVKPKKQRVGVSRIELLRRLRKRGFSKTDSRELKRAMNAASAVLSHAGHIARLNRRKSKQVKASKKQRPAAARRQRPKAKMPENEIFLPKEYTGQVTVAETAGAGDGGAAFA